MIKFSARAEFISGCFLGVSSIQWFSFDRLLPGPSLLWLDVQTLQPFAFLERLLYNSLTRVGRLLPGLSLLWLDVQAMQLPVISRACPK